MHILSMLFLNIVVTNNQHCGVLFNLICEESLCICPYFTMSQDRFLAVQQCLLCCLELVFLSPLGALYCAVRSYSTKKHDEVSVPIGSVVEVLRKSDDGWWLIR